MESSLCLPAQHRIEKILDSEEKLPRALCRDLSNNTLSLALATEGAHAARLLTRKALRHRHLATLLQVVEGSGSSTFLAEHVPGITLAEARAKEAIDPFKALIWFTRLLEALSALSEESAVHGAISPLAIIVDPEQRAIAPVLTQLAVPAIGAYCSPERLLGLSPSSADDTWSLLASLYFAITGKPPFGSESSEKIKERVQARQLAPLADFGVDDPELERLFVAAFHPDPARRITRITRIREAFDKIERGESLPGSLFIGDAPSLRPHSNGSENEPIVFNEADILAALVQAKTDGLSHVPRAAQASLGPDITLGPQLSIGPGDSLWPAAIAESREDPPIRKKPASSAPPPFGKKKAKVWPLAFAAGVGAAAVFAGVVLSGNGGEPTPPVSFSPPAVSAAKPVPKTSASLSPDECLLSYFPVASVANTPKLSFLCEKKSFPEGTASLFALIRAHAEKKAEENAPPPLADARAPEPRKGDKDAGVNPLLLAALPYQAELGWHDLAAAAIMKRNCCPKAQQNIELPRTTGYCPQLADVVQSLADASALPGDLSPQARRFDEAVSCLVTTKTPHSFSYEGGPTPESRAAFQRFLTYAAVSDARRSVTRR